MEPNTLLVFPSSGLSTRISLHVKLGSETQLHQQCLETWRESDQLSSTSSRKLKYARIESLAVGRAIVGVALPAQVPQLAGRTGKVLDMLRSTKLKMQQC